jgi:hypothetical protein
MLSRELGPHFGVRAAQAAALVRLGVACDKGQQCLNLSFSEERKVYQSGGLCRTHSKGFAVTKEGHSWHKQSAGFQPTTANCQLPTV